MFLEIFDRLLQFLSAELLEGSKYIYISLPQVALLYRSENFIVIEKPPDLLINSNDHTKASVQNVLKKKFPELINAELTHDFYFAHRLDYSTSGILCVPLNRRACAALCSSFENRKSKKFYIALVNGVVSEQVQTIEYAIGEDVRYEATNKKMCTNFQAEFCKDPRNSLTHMCVISTGFYLNRPVTKVMLMPVTGRRHQLRVHCSSLGHPIVGDYTYGTGMDKYLSRMFLHAIRLEVPNDVEGIQIETKDPFNADILKDWYPDETTPKDLRIFYELLENRIYN